MKYQNLKMETKQKLKVGDKIVCITNSYKDFTKGKEYEIFNIDSRNIMVLNDYGVSINFFSIHNSFKLKEEKVLEYISEINFLYTKIDDCDLSIRTKNICRMNNFKVLRDLIAYTSKDLMMLNFGKRTISEIKEFLMLKGYALGS